MSIDPLTALLDVGQSVIERIWPDANKRAEEMRKLEELRQAGNIEDLKARVQLLTGQMEVNKIEAHHKSIFVAGWRPFVGWVGGCAFAYMGIIEPMARFVANLSGYTGEYPVIDTGMTMQVLLGMLGLGMLRSYDKTKGVETTRVGK